MKLTDVLELTVKGYKMQEINEVKDIIASHPEEESNIIALAKKVNVTELKTAMAIAEAYSDDTPSGEKEGVDNKGATDPQMDTTPKPEKQEDNVDYRKLYEEEKKLREDLQHSNTLKKVENKDNRSDEEIAVAYAESIL